MRGMPVYLQGKGAVEVTTTTQVPWRSKRGDKACLRKKGLEPRSVLDHRRRRRRRSPSPPTSTSTLSSSLEVGGCSVDTASVAPVSGDAPHIWLTSQGSIVSGPAEDAVGGGAVAGGCRKEEWASELHPVPAGLEIGLVGADKCSLVMEDWDTVLSQPSAMASPPCQDQTFLRWVMGDVGDASADTSPRLQNKLNNHHQPQVLSQATLNLGDGAGGCVPGFEVFDPVFGFEYTYEIGGTGADSQAVASSVACPATVASGGGVPVVNNNGGNRILPIQPGHGFSSSPASSIPLPLSPPPGMLFRESELEEKAHVFGPNALLDQKQVQPSHNPAFFLPPSTFMPPVDGHDLFLRRHQQQSQQQPPRPSSGHGPQSKTIKPKLPEEEAAAAAAQQQQTLVDQFSKAAELIEVGNFVDAHGILARLNHHLLPIGKPLIRSAFYCKEVLQCIVTSHSSHSSTTTSPSPPLQRYAPLTALTSPLDVILKLSAYKAFSDISPVLQFANFTCTQALLEELTGFDRIHILDFDLGVGGHWSSLMQELAAQRRFITDAAAAPPSLRITAFVSPSHHPFELALTRENLSHFACELNIPFEFNILSGDSFDPAGLLSCISQSGEAVAVNLPAAGSAYPSVSTLVSLVKRLRPKIVVSVVYGCDHSDLTFTRHCLHVLQSMAVLLDSIDAAGGSLEMATKIERYLLQPRIENSIVGCFHAADKPLPWWNLFASAGFSPVPFSNFAETQAECLMKRLQFPGFQVEKRQASLLLCWQRVGLVSVSAWRC